MLTLFVDNPHVVQIFAMLGIGAILVIAGCLLLGFLEELLDRFSRLGWACKVGVLFLVVQLTMFGGTNDVDDVAWTNDVEGIGWVNGNGEAESFPLQGEGLRGPFLSGRPSQSLTSGEDTASPLTSGETPLPLVSAQIELDRNGDFITRSNNVESVYRRVIEPNPEPLDPYGPVLDLSVVNETNAYCWVDIVVNIRGAFSVSRCHCK